MNQHRSFLPSFPMGDVSAKVWPTLISTLQVDQLKVHFLLKFNICIEHPVESRAMFAETLDSDRVLFGIYILTFVWVYQFMLYN